jgi:predicted transcriptional regulator
MRAKIKALRSISVRLPGDIKQRVDKIAADNRLTFSRALTNLLAENIDGPSWRAIDQIAADLRVVSDRQHTQNLLGDLTRATDNLLKALALGDQSQIEVTTIDARRAVDMINREAQFDIRRAHTTGAL